MSTNCNGNCEQCSKDCGERTAENMYEKHTTNLMKIVKIK